MMADLWSSRERALIKQENKQLREWLEREEHRSKCVVLGEKAKPPCGGSHPRSED